MNIAKKLNHIVLLDEELSIELVTLREREIKGTLEES